MPSLGFSNCSLISECDIDFTSSLARPIRLSHNLYDILPYFRIVYCPCSQTLRDPLVDIFKRSLSRHQSIVLRANLHALSYMCEGSDRRKACRNCQAYSRVGQNIQAHMYSGCHPSHWQSFSCMETSMLLPQKVLNVAGCMQTAHLIPVQIMTLQRMWRACHNRLLKGTIMI